MSIRQAIATASKEALQAYLSPELCEQLSEEIVHRASAEIEGALSAFAGFDLGRPASAKARGPQATAKAAAARRGRKAKAEHTSGENLVRNGGDDHNGEHEPSPEQMV